MGPNRILLDVFARDPASGKIVGSFFPFPIFPSVRTSPIAWSKLLRGKFRRGSSCASRLISLI